MLTIISSSHQLIISSELEYFFWFEIFWEIPKCDTETQSEQMLLVLQWNIIWS